MAGRNALGLDIGGVGLDRAGEEPGLLTAVQNMPDSYAYFRFAVRPARGPGLVSGGIAALEPAGRQLHDRARRPGRARPGGVRPARAQRSEPGSPAPGWRCAWSTPKGSAPRWRWADHIGATGIGARYSDVLVPLSAFAASASSLDLSNLVRLELVFDDPPGALLVDDLRFE